MSGSVSRLLVPYVVLALAWQVPTFLMSGAPLTGSALTGGLEMLVFASGVDVPGLGVAAVGMAWFLAALFTSRLLPRCLRRACCLMRWYGCLTGAKLGLFGGALSVLR